MPRDEAVRLLESNPRLFWGNAIKVLIDRGWTPPKPDERIVDDLLDAMRHVDIVPQPTESMEKAIAYLTPRERTVALLLIEGLTNDEIAARLDIGSQSVKFHLGNVYRKLEVRGRQEAVAVILRAAA